MKVTARQDIGCMRVPLIETKEQYSHPLAVWVEIENNKTQETRD